MSAQMKAFLIHFFISCCMAGLLFTLVFGFWYPSPLGKAVGVFDVFLIMLFVDVVIGPLLTWVVYKPEKKTLKLDISIIAILQMSALAYGVWTCSEGRPAWVVFNERQFDLVRVMDLDNRRIDQAKSEYKSPSLFGPRWVGVQEPKDEEQQGDIVWDSVFAGVELSQKPNYYVELKIISPEILTKAKALSELLKYNDPNMVSKVIKDFPKAKSWLPLKSGHLSMVVLLGAEGDVISVVDLSPWEQ